MRTQQPKPQIPYRSEGFAWAPTIVLQEQLTDALELARRVFQRRENRRPLLTCQANDLRPEQKSRLESASQRPSDDRGEFANDPLPDLDSTQEYRNQPLCCFGESASRLTRLAAP